MLSCELHIDELRRVTDDARHILLAEELQDLLDSELLFVAGLAIVRAHNLWTWRWPVIITLTGWVALIVGLWRMAMPDAPQMADNVVTYLVLAAIGAIGIALSVKAYGSKVFAAQEHTDD